jgi:hypothetical protein
MSKRTKANYNNQRQQALEFGKKPPFSNHPQAELLGVNMKGGLDKVLFGTCDTCDYFFAENINPLPGIDVDGDKHPCGSGCKGTVTQIYLKIQ